MPAARRSVPPTEKQSREFSQGRDWQRQINKKDMDAMQGMIDELVEALFAQYQRCPDANTRKLLISHMGHRFFEMERIG